MSLKRIIGIVICIGGIVLIFVSNYIKSQVESGKMQISSAESQVSQGKTLFGLNPVSKQVGNQVFFNSAEQQINAGKKDVAYYESLASQLQIAGIIAIVVGLGIVFIPFTTHKRK
jgi:uncharacterized membrane protein HdeD (DUF308 family)